MRQWSSLKYEQIKILTTLKNDLRVCKSFKPGVFPEAYKGRGLKICVWFILILQNVRIGTGFPAEYFELLESSQNGSYHRVKALQEGLTLIDATLKAVVDEVSLIATVTRSSLCFSWIIIIALTLDPFFPLEKRELEHFLCPLFSFRLEGSTHSPTQSTMNRM